MIDKFGRNIDYMRVSITDRCNLRCKYCMPEGCDKVPMSDILTFEQILRICKAATGLGIRKIKVTGGEPFVRLGCTDLIRDLKNMPGIEEVTVTTNGQNLYRYIDELKDIGIDGINISLDTVDPERFRYITGGGSLDRTLQAIDLSLSAGIKTKVNCLLQKNFNEDELRVIAGLAANRKLDVRFIEMMPIGVGNPDDGVSNRKVLRRLSERWPGLEPDNTKRGNGPAVYYSCPEIEGSIGFISAIHGVFCSSCNRIRCTSQGVIKPCLCYENGTDLKPYLDGSEDILMDALREAILSKPEAHCFNKKKFARAQYTEHRLMSQIGG